VSDLLPAGTVTVADLYRELVGMRADLSRVLVHQEAIDTRMQTADRLDTDHETRIRGLERFRYTIGGLSLVGGAVAGYLGYLLGHFVH
jgi:hypothetical protein